MESVVVQMITSDRVGQQTLPVDVRLASADSSAVTLKDILAAASKKFKVVNNKSRVYHGSSGAELLGDVPLADLSGAFLVFAGKAGWKGSVHLANVAAAGSAEGANSTCAAPTQRVSKWDGIFRGRLGVDIGGVLNQHVNDMESKSQWWLQVESEAPNAMASLEKLVDFYGPPNVFIVSKVAGNMLDLTNVWLHKTMAICERTAMLKENIHFCPKRSGKDGKGPVAKELQLSHFVDDNFECLQSYFCDPAGHSQHSIKENGGILVLFARSGLGTEQPPKPTLPKGMEPFVSTAANWDDVLKVLVTPRPDENGLAAHSSEDMNENLLDAAQTQRSEGVVLCWKDTQNNGYLSNWAPSKIVLEGSTYNCVEQFIMASKARACGDESVREAIMRTPIPAKQKKLGRSLDKKAVARHWKMGHKWRVQLQGARAKFSQNPELGARLLRTGQKPIAEASPSDVVFGIGLAPNNPLAQDPANWKGFNLLGKALMQAREELRAHVIAGNTITSLAVDRPVELALDDCGSDSSSVSDHSDEDEG